MLNRCPNCSGTLQFDIPSQKVKCQHCDSVFEPGSLPDDTKATEVDDLPEYDADLFVCPACGAEISSTELDAVNYCLYCGSFVSLDRHIRKVQRPERIVPFSKTIEDCRKNYNRSIRNRLYGRSECLKEEFLDGFKPIFIPHWEYTYSVGPEIKTEKDVRTVKGGYEYGRKDYIRYQATGSFTGLSFDASSTFDDAIGYQIAPYDTANALPFHPAYMYGFFGDTADVTADVYEETANRQMTDYVHEKITKERAVKKDGAELPSARMNDWTGFSGSASLTMLPVWFLTWRKDDRVAYSVMNGATGKMHTEIPISVRRYLVLALITAIPIFLLLNLNFTFMGDELLRLALILASLTQMLHMCEMERIITRTLHLNDKGYVSVHSETAEIKKSYVGSKLANLTERLFFRRKKKSVILTLLLALVIYLLLSVKAISTLTAAFCTLGIPLITLKHNRKCAKYLSGQKVWQDTIGSVLAAFISGIILLAAPAADLYYYTAGIGCLIGVALTAIMTMRRYNDLITRPIPRFFDREKGGKAA